MSFKKYPKIYALGKEETRDILQFFDDFVIIEEKVDGGNGSFWEEEDGTHFGTRNRDLTSDGDKKTFARLQIALREHLEKLEKGLYKDG